MEPTPDQIRASINQRYADLARSPDSEKAFRVGPGSAKALGYSAVEIDGLPSSVTECFAGVGNPFSLGELQVGQTVLDLGCGAGIHKEVCEHAGFEWVGIDYDSKQAGLLGDAHALPFKSNSFEFILCITVLQYMRYPFVAMREISRVLQPQGKLIGTVAFLEPFNGIGFYNSTHLGITNLLQYGDFKIDKISPTRNWSGLIALASMGLFPKMPRPIAKSLVFPLEQLHKFWWQVGDLVTRKNRENMRLRNFAGSFTFIASKK